jgi:hypothetical protein
MNMACVEALHGLSEVPYYVSIETSATSGTANYDNAFAELAHLGILGYRNFKYVDQAAFAQLNGVDLHIEGTAIKYVFREHTSGPFGEENPGEWKTIDECVSLSVTRIPLGLGAATLMAYSSRPVGGSDDIGRSCHAIADTTCTRVVLNLGGSAAYSRRLARRPFLYRVGQSSEGEDKPSDPLETSG